MSAFLLSNVTKAVWLERGAIQLTRIKDEDEDFNQDGRSIYLFHQSCWAIVRKYQLIQESMSGVKEGEIESPCNIVLHKQQVIRLSEYHGQYYYGLHILDNEGHVKIGRGMNLTEDEYQELVNKLMIRFVEKEKKKDNQNISTSVVISRKKKNLTRNQ